MRILVTGAAGFIGYHTALALLKDGHQVVGVDNLNDYYNPKLKLDRLRELGIQTPDLPENGQQLESVTWRGQFRFVKMPLEHTEMVAALFRDQEFDVVCHLAAQAGVRYSLENPHAYVQSNVVAFLNVLECCRHHNIGHLVYASSSSVYGNNENIPFTVEDRVDKPISLYAATKVSNELMAHTYSHLYGLPTTGLRFFTVYGPWGRPDMALFLFTDAIVNGRPIDVFNHGNMARDFTYIDDIVQGVVKILVQNVQGRDPLSKLYNIGNNNSVKLNDFIASLERVLDKKAIKNMQPMQPGDVARTWANVDALQQDYNYHPSTPVEVGVQRFVEWYKEYYAIG